MLANLDLIKSNPIIVGLVGRAGSGKTSTVDQLLYSHDNDFVIDDTTLHIQWDHITHSRPLYEFASIRTKITGLNAEARQLKQIENLVEELIGDSLKHFKKRKIKKLTQKIYKEPIARDGKPRSFLQNVGTLCREVDIDCFTRWAINKANERFTLSKDFYNETDIVVPIISDVRFINEAQHLKAEPRSLIIKLTASDKVLTERLLDRDGFTLSESEKNHESEVELQSIKFNSYIDKTIDTTELTLEEQAEAVKQAVISIIKGL